MRIIKRIIFQLLLMFRGLVLVISGLVSIFCLIVIPIMAYHLGLHNKAQLFGVVIFVIFGIIATFINWFYDDLILYLQPDNSNIILFR